VFLAHPLVSAQPSRVTRLFSHAHANGRRERGTRRRKRGRKAYPCRSLRRRVAITGGFIHCTPLTSSLGRSFTPLPSPGITEQPPPTAPRSSTTFAPPPLPPALSMTSLRELPLQLGMSSPTPAAKEGKWEGESAEWGTGTMA
jgi:hypothetical protein